MNHLKIQDSLNNSQVRFKNGDILDIYIDRTSSGGVKGRLLQNGKLVRTEEIKGKPRPMKNVTNTIKNVTTKKLLEPKESFLKKIKNNIQKLIGEK